VPCVTGVAGSTAIACIPAVSGIPAASGVSLVHDDQTVGVVAVVCNPAVAGNPAVLVPAIDGVLAIASVPADPGVPIFAGLFTTALTMRHFRLRQSDC
jgi:hypothetical protein